MKVRLSGIMAHGKIHLSGLKRVGVDRRKIPPYFTIEVDLKTIKKREKNGN